MNKEISILEFGNLNFKIQDSDKAFYNTISNEYFIVDENKNEIFFDANGQLLHMDICICNADCFRDSNGVIRPLSKPKELVWSYYETSHPFSLKERKFTDCKCGCGNLTANPSVSIRMA